MAEAVSVPTGSGVNLISEDGERTWLVPGTVGRLWIEDEAADECQLHLVVGTPEEDSAEALCKVSVPAFEGELWLVDEADAVGVEREHPGEYLWCDDCLSAADLS